MNKKKLVVLTGAGVSAESGIQTFRDAGGLWEGHDVMEVASPEGWRKNQALVQQFYNERRRALKNVQPNRAHYILAELEEYFDVTVITQNVDHLHEQAGSSKIIHLHGELLKARSTRFENLVYDWTEDITPNDKCEKGYPLRPHIVWFGEAVPMITPAAAIASEAEILVVIGTSLLVYPAASLAYHADESVPIFLVDPKKPPMYDRPNVYYIIENATTGTEKLKQILIEKYG